MKNTLQPLINIHCHKTKFGELIIGSKEDKLCLCDWKYRKMRKSIDERIMKGLEADYLEKKTDIHDDCIKQLNEYFQGERKEFDLELKLTGTPFQIKVWEELQRINYGETISYQMLSERLGDVKAIRAVAAANGANAVSIIIPCHRIIGSNNELIGYAGGLNTKRKLLDLESGIKQFEIF